MEENNIKIVPEGEGTRCMKISQEKNLALKEGRVSELEFSCMPKRGSRLWGPEA